MTGPVRYMESMWRNLPAEILEKVVLPFLPLASLCRFRTVSKKWNTLISLPDFALSHARASGPEEYVLVTVQCDRPFDSNGGWEVLDVANNRFFTLSDDFLKQEGIVPAHEPSCDWNERAILAADGGLFCLSYSFNSETTALLVCNPLLRTAKELPHLGGWDEGFSGNIVMSTDRISMEYEIFVFVRDDDQYQPNAVDIYESKTGRWRRDLSTVPPRRDNSGKSCDYGASFTFVMLNHGFYQLLIRHDDHLQSVRIVFYDKVTGMASELGYGVPCDDDIEIYELVVSSDRLFCVTMRPGIRMSDYRSIKIFEVILARNECILFTEMPKELLNWVLGDDLNDDDCDIDGVIDFYESKPIVSTGCANSILISSCIGRSLGHSLLDRSWYHYSDNNLLHAQEHFSSTWNYQDLFGSNHCLSFCPP